MSFLTRSRLPTLARSFSTSTIVRSVRVERISAGDGKNFPKVGDSITIHYTGTLARGGSKFDSSVDRGQPFSCQIGVFVVLSHFACKIRWKEADEIPNSGQVISGWDVGVPQLSLGEKAKLHITADSGYGSQGAGGVIPPNASLVFEVELLAIN